MAYVAGSSFSAPKCRLCGCPVVDGGVALSTVDRDKLSGWWTARRGVPLREEVVRDGWSCMNCVRQAKQDCEISCIRDNLAWWPEVKDPLYKYFLEGWLTSCSVVLKKINEEEIIEDNQKDSSLTFLDQSLKLDPPPLPLPPNKHQNTNSYVEECQHCLKKLIVRRRRQHHKHFTRGLCRACNINFPCRGLLNVHSKSCRIKCDICNFLATSRSSLIRHITNRHKEALGFIPCKVCGNCFRPKYFFEIHAKSCHRTDDDKKKKKENFAKEPLICRYCSEEFVTQEELKEHVTSKHRNSRGLQACDLCGLRVIKSGMERHLEKFCSRKIDDAPLVEKRISASDKSKLSDRTCDLCLCMFSTAVKRQSHFCPKREVITPKISCLYCKLDMYPEYLDFHQTKHSCSFCQEVMNCSALMEKHKEDFRTCPWCPWLCNYNYCSDTALEKHMHDIHKYTLSQGDAYKTWSNLEHQSANVKCYKCRMFFKDIAALIAHNLDEHFLGRYPCDICAALLKKESDMANHLLRAHGVVEKVAKDQNGVEFTIKCQESLQCPQCPRTFMAQFDLAMHFQKCHKAGPAKVIKVVSLTAKNLQKNSKRNTLKTQQLVSSDAVKSDSVEICYSPEPVEDELLPESAIKTELVEILEESSYLVESLEASGTANKSVDQEELLEHFVDAKKENVEEMEFLEEPTESRDPLEINTEPLLPAESSNLLEIEAKTVQTYECSYCSYKDKVRIMMVAHIENFHMVGNFNSTCSNCKLDFAYNSPLRKNHFCPGKFKIACSVCNLFMYPEFLASHNLSTTCATCRETFFCETHFLTHQDRQRSCKICKTQFCQETKFLQHCVDVHKYTKALDFVQGLRFSNAGHECKPCGYFFENADILENHRRQNHSERVACEFCARLFLDSKSLRDHYAETHRIEKGQICYQEPPAWRYEVSLEGQRLQYKRKIFKNEALKVLKFKFFRCRLCIMVLVDKASIDDHVMKEHFSTCNLCCPLCDFWCDSHEKLYSHLSSFHNAKAKSVHLLHRWHSQCCGDPIKNFLLRPPVKFHCGCCDFTLPDARALRKHIDTKDVFNPERCRFCPNVFTNYNAYKHHINLLHFPELQKRFHLKERRYDCEECAMDFLSSADWMEHWELSHKGAQNSPTNSYECTICKVECATKIAITEHVTYLHLRDDSHCKVCAQWCAEKKEMTAHLRTHPTLMFCDYCELDFDKKCDLERHIKEKHLVFNRCFNCFMIFQGEDVFNEHLEQVFKGIQQKIFTEEKFKCLPGGRPRLL